MPCLPFLFATLSFCPLICSCAFGKINSPRTERERPREMGKQGEGASVAGQGAMCSITIPIELAGC